MMDKTQNVFSVLLLLGCILLVGDAKQMKVEFRDTKLLNVSPLIANYSYGVQRVNKTTQMFGAEISLNSDVLIDNAMAIMGLYMKRRNSEFEPYLFKNITANVCHLGESRVKFSMLEPLLSGVKIETNVLHACPYSGRLYGRVYFFDSASYPDILPFGEYYNHMIFYTKRDGGKHIIGTIRIYFDLLPK